MEQGAFHSWPQRLAATALTLGEGPDFATILQSCQQALADQPRNPLIALGLVERRRNVTVIMIAGRDSADPAADGAELPIDQTEFPNLTEAVYVSAPFGEPGAPAIEAVFAETGRHRYVACPLVLRDDTIGVLYAAIEGREEPGEQLLQMLGDLAAVIPSAVQNERTQVRLAKGDRRRASLVELSHAINTSLEFDAVISSTLEAVRDIEGHVASMVMLRRDGDGELQCFSLATPATRTRGAAPQQEVINISDTSLPWVLEHERTFESPDLQDQAATELDYRLLRGSVRRYALAPMFVRGRIIGGFLFATADPHPSLTTDVWLYENIALQLALAIDNARQFGQLKRLSDRLAEQNIYLREEIATEHNVGGMIGQSPQIRRVVQAIQRVAQTESTVLITGETGVGKELVARAIHEESDRADYPLVKVNCAAIPENLVESELFGHERGAFTSATSRRLGRFELAREGTIFLDEVGELPLAVQSKLLRVLQEKEFERVGGSQTLTTDARIIAATNRDLLESVEKKAFRSDLYYRLNVFPIRVPSLADRREDIPLLIDAFVSQFNRRMGKAVRRIEPATLEYLKRRAWPGNIRELRHVVERAMILCDGEELVISTADAAEAPATTTEAATAEADPRDDLRLLEIVEREHIVRVLEASRWRIEGAGGAAEVLGLRPSTLRSRLKKLSIKRQ